MSKVETWKIEALRFQAIAAACETDAVKALAAKFKAAGRVTDPVQVNSLGQVILGNEIARAARLAGYAEIPVVIIISDRRTDLPEGMRVQHR